MYDMQLWTYHPSTFPVDDPNLEVDYTRGIFWRIEMGQSFRYRVVLPKLHDLVKTTQFLWCCTLRGTYPRTWEGDDSVEWELNAPLTQILTFYRKNVWDDIVWSRSDDWAQLLIPVGEKERVGDENLGALVRVPLKSDWAKCHG
jgi:hypothetical protein